MKKVIQFSYLALFLIALHITEKAWGWECCSYTTALNIDKNLYYSCWYPCSDYSNTCFLEAWKGTCTPNQSAPPLNTDNVKIITQEEFKNIQ